MRLTVLLPDVAGQIIHGGVDESHTLPLRRLLARATFTELNTTTMSALLSMAGFEAHHSEAELLWNQGADTATDPVEVLASKHYLNASLVQVNVGHNGIYLTNVIDQVGAELTEKLAHLCNRHFADGDLQWMASGEQLLLESSADWPVIDPPEPRRIVGQNIAHWLPADMSWQSLINELQMLCHSPEFSAAVASENSELKQLAEAGALSFWLWGGGEAWHCDQQTWQSVASNQPLLGALASRCGAARLDIYEGLETHTVVGASLLDWSEQSLASEQLVSRLRSIEERLAAAEIVELVLFFNQRRAQIESGRKRFWQRMPSHASLVE